MDKVTEYQRDAAYKKHLASHNFIQAKQRYDKAAKALSEAQSEFTLAEKGLAEAEQALAPLLPRKEPSK